MTVKGEAGRLLTGTNTSVGVGVMKDTVTGDGDDNDDDGGAAIEIDDCTDEAGWKDDATTTVG